jgi:translation initiation factor IF-3
LRPFRPFTPREPQIRCNGKIRAREVRVLGADKQQIGVLPLAEALRLAQSQHLDLIEISPDANPPVCRIVDFGKYRYEEAKKQKERASANNNKLKEIQLSAVIDPHDFQTKVNHAIEFLCADMKVRLKLRFKGRQKAHKEYGFEVVNKFVRELAAYAYADSPPKLLGDRDLNVLLTPLPKEKRARPRLEATAASQPPTS